jgi:hypothetical protein
MVRAKGDEFQLWGLTPEHNWLRIIGGTRAYCVRERTARINSVKPYWQDLRVMVATEEPLPGLGHVYSTFRGASLSTTTNQSKSGKNQK